MIDHLRKAFDVQYATLQGCSGTFQRNSDAVVDRLQQLQVQYEVRVLKCPNSTSICHL